MTVTIHHRASFLFISLCALIPLLSGAEPARGGTDAVANSQTAPGVVIDHSPQSSGLYIGSPSLVVLTNGDYLASHDLFGPKSDEFNCPTTRVFCSTDRGGAWREVAKLKGQFWSNLFVHRGVVYLMGTDKHHGRIVIRRSLDGGHTWTEPRDASSGVLATGQFHTAPVPVVEHAGRLWRAFEDASTGTKWGERYQAGMLSVPVDADLLNATNWTPSNFLRRDPQWNGRDFTGWLEGNAVVTRDGRLVNILRVDTANLPERAAIVNISADGNVASFDPSQGLIDFPGGAKKFTIRFDPESDTYWSVASIVLTNQPLTTRPGGVRNTLALTTSPDLKHWTVRAILLQHPDVKRHGFQYVDWQFDDEDIIAVCRTAFDDDAGGAHNNHDANFLTFHRWEQARRLHSASTTN